MIQSFKALTEIMNNHIPPELVINISTADSLSIFVAEFFAGLCADCGESCLERISKYKKIIAPVVMELKKGKEETVVIYSYKDGTAVPRNMILNDQLSILSIVRKFITENNNMWGYMKGELNQRLREIEVDESFSAVVRKIIIELISSGSVILKQDSSIQQQNLH